MVSQQRSNSGSKPLPDIIAPGLIILFIGYNPGLRSAEMGHHYAGSSNRFWDVLYRSGLTGEKLNYTRDRDLLKFGFGSTNIVDRPSKSASEILREEYLRGRVTLRELLQEYRPAIACYVGIGVFKAFTGKAGVSWGRQVEVSESGIIDFVAPSTSGLNRMTTEQLVGSYRDLKELIDKGNSTQMESQAPSEA